MLDYCRKTLDESFASHVKATDVMWQITCGLDYLHRQKIQHGNLKLENVLFWKRDSKSKRVVVKLAGYGSKVLLNLHSAVCYRNMFPFYLKKLQDAKSDLFQLGCLFYSAATKKETDANGSVPLDSLSEIDEYFRALALDLISLLVNGCLSNNVKAGTVLLHPFFTRCSEESRSRFIQDLMDDKVGLIWNDAIKLRKWLDSVSEERYQDEDVDDFKDIVSLPMEIK